MGGHTNDCRLQVTCQKTMVVLKSGILGDTYSSVHGKIDAMQIVHDTTKRLSHQQNLRLPESVLVE